MPSLPLQAARLLDCNCRPDEGAITGGRLACQAGPSGPDASQTYCKDMRCSRGACAVVRAWSGPELSCFATLQSKPRRSCRWRSLYPTGQRVPEVCRIKHHCIPLQPQKSSCWQRACSLCSPPSPKGQHITACTSICLPKDHVTPQYRIIRFCKPHGRHTVLSTSLQDLLSV